MAEDFSRPQESLIRRLDTSDKITESSLTEKKTDETIPSETPVKPESKFKEAAVKRDLTFKEKLRNSFIRKEDLKDIGEYLLFDILIPGVQRNIFDIILGSASRALHISIPSDIRNYYPGSSDGYSPRREYRQYDREARESRRRRSMPSTKRYNVRNVNDITYNFREDADTLLSDLIDVARTRPNEWISVHTFYHLAEVHDGNEYTNAAYGWPARVILEEAIVDNEGYGYYICLPHPREIPRGRY